MGGAAKKQKSGHRFVATTPLKGQNLKNLFYFFHSFIADIQSLNHFVEKYFKKTSKSW